MIDVKDFQRLKYSTVVSQKVTHWFKPIGSYVLFYCHEFKSLALINRLSGDNVSMYIVNGPTVEAANVEELLRAEIYLLRMLFLGAYEKKPLATKETYPLITIFRDLLD